MYSNDDRFISKGLTLQLLQVDTYLRTPQIRPEYKQQAVRLMGKAGMVEGFLMMYGKSGLELVMKI